jgi:cytochrome c oxidase cbb3-type subunit 3
MNETRDPLLLDHEVDGIRELDNKLPRWWVWLFYLTAAFAPIYLVYYHALGAGDLSAEAYAKEMVVGNQIKEASMAKFESQIDQSNPSQEAPVLDRGKQNFLQLCAPCHRVDGGGLVGPNLTDDYWIHGDQFADTLRTIWNGVPEKGMVTWKGVLKPEEVQAVASYIYSLRGSNPPNPKPPESQGAAPAVNEYE